MLRIKTNRGKAIEIIQQTELCEPLQVGDHVRSYCHLHGSDHQRSLSIDKATGWGHCFNAACDATVLVAEWNPDLARRLIHTRYQGLTFTSSPSTSALPTQRQQTKPRAHPAAWHAPKSIQTWQQDEAATLRSLEECVRTALVNSKRAQAYLQERTIPLELALATGVWYLPSALPNWATSAKKNLFLRRWGERMIFPLASPQGKGYIGRSLWGWQPGMDENAHKRLLEQGHTPKRWIKTNPAGWFGYEPAQFAESVILVEGAFDRLTLLAAGFRRSDVVALVGTAAQANWLLAHVKSVILALDADEGGKGAMSRLAEHLTQAGFDVKLCSPPQDRWGKDWNERWQRIGAQSVWPLLEAYSHMLHIA
jgi:5S rRNA maturation endonuclease (ribonuclease M5)